MENHKAIIYARVSTEEQDQEGLSIDVQISRVRGYCLAQGYEVYDVISDKGYSAKSLERPGLQSCFTKLENRLASILVFFKLDRLTRSVRDLGTILDKMSTFCFEIASVLDSLDTSTATGRLQLNIMVSLAQWERETIAERTKEAHEYKRRRGEKNGGSRPFGFNIRLQDGKKILIPNNREQSTINLIQELRGDGFSLSAICKELKRRKRSNSSGNTNWKPMTVKRILDRKETMQ